MVEAPFGYTVISLRKTGTNMKKKKICVVICLLAVAMAAGIFCYYRFYSGEAEDMRGGTLVYERDIVYSDRAEC